MRRTYVMWGGLIVLVFVLVLTVYVPLQQKDFSETIDIAQADIVRVQLNTPSSHAYKSTCDQEKIDVLLEYLSRFQYEDMVGNETGYFPRRASIIYLYDKDGASNFIVPYVREAMINQIFYKVKNGTIEEAWLVGFYESL